MSFIDTNELLLKHFKWKDSSLFATSMLNQINFNTYWAIQGTISIKCVANLKLKKEDEVKFQS